jgi:hypothetical protein
MAVNVLFKTSSVLESSTSDLEGVGTVRQVGDSFYRWVKNDETTTALSQYDVCCHQVTNEATMLRSVKVPATADLYALAGVVASTSIAAGSYGWICIKGPYSARVLLATQTTNNPLTLAYLFLGGVDAQVYASPIDGTTTGFGEFFRYLYHLVTTTATYATSEDATAKVTRSVYVNCL